MLKYRLASDAAREATMEWLNYHHLLYFWTVARTGGVSAASAELRLAQPTISGQLRMLEEHFGELKEEKRTCKKLDCERRRIRDTAYCLEHHIAQRFGRQLSRLERLPPKDAEP